MDGLKGQCVLVPADLKKVQTTLPRSCNDEHIITLALKRRLKAPPSKGGRPFPSVSDQPEKVGMGRKRSEKVGNLKFSNKIFKICLNEVTYVNSVMNG